MITVHDDDLNPLNVALLADMCQGCYTSQSPSGIEELTDGAYLAVYFCPTCLKFWPCWYSIDAVEEAFRDTRIILHNRQAAGGEW